MQIEFSNRFYSASVLYITVCLLVLFFCRKWCETRGTTTSWLRISWRKNASNFIFHHMWHFCRNLIVQCHNNASLLLFFSFPIMSLRKRYAKGFSWIATQLLHFPHRRSATNLYYHTKIEACRQLHKYVASSIWNCSNRELGRSWNDTRMDVYHTEWFSITNLMSHNFIGRCALLQSILVTLCVVTVWYRPPLEATSPDFQI